MITLMWPQRLVNVYRCGLDVNCVRDVVAHIGQTHLSTSRLWTLQQWQMKEAEASHNPLQLLVNSGHSSADVMCSSTAEAHVTESDITHAWRADTGVMFWWAWAGVCASSYVHIRSRISVKSFCAAVRDVFSCFRLFPALCAGTIALLLACHGWSPGCC